MRRAQSPHGVDRRARDRSRSSPYFKDDITGRKPGGNRLPPYNRVFVSNIPYEEKWQFLKDLFRDKVGEVTYVELITDDMGKSRGYGIVEFKTKELVNEAVKKMSGHEINKRKIIVKEDPSGDLLRKFLMRDGIRGRSNGRDHGMMPPPMHMPGMPPPMSGRMSEPRNNMPPHHPPPPLPPPPRVPEPIGNINPQMLEDITGGGPIGNTIFIANLDYKVTYSKVKEVFSLAGNVTKVDLHLDKEHKSRGMATVTYDTAMEAVQAISMFHKQLLYDRPMVVKMDKDNAQSVKNSLPTGLQGIGPSLNLGNRVPRSDTQRDQPISGHSDGRGLSELERLAVQSALDGGLNGNFNNYPGASNPGGIPGLGKPMMNANSLAMNLSAIGQQSNPILNSLSAGGLGSGLQQSAFDSLRMPGTDIGRLSAALGGRRIGLDGQAEERSRFLSPNMAISDRERIEMDIARVDSRIRDLDRSLAAVETRKANMNQNQGGGDERTPNCTVFVRNLPFSLTWQKLRDKFCRIGNVQFAEIKMENGRSKGYGHVRFETPEQAQVAIRHFDGMDIDGRKIEVRLNEESKFGQRH